MSEPIIILGASARAAAFSAARGGFRPWAADLFADADLARLCPAARIARYPCDFVAAARGAPRGAWLYTGGLENYPRVIERIAAERTLYGSVGAPLRRVRDPRQLAKVLEAVGLPFPAVRLSSTGLPRDGSWLRKGLRSSGGSRVESWDEANRAPAEMRGWYFQARVAGSAHAAAFLAAGGESRLLGITRQYIGGDNELGDVSGAAPFHYAGSIGPLEVDPEVRRQLQRLGEVLAGEFGLVGLCGVDFVLEEDRVWPIEVNPRYPSSVEVLERALGFSAIQLHVAACRHQELPEIARFASSGRVAGKAILFAKAPLELDDTMQRKLAAESRLQMPPLLADIPSGPNKFTTASPIVTVLADGGEVAHVVDQLSRRLEVLRRDLAGR